VMEFDNIETIKRAVEIDAGVALLPEPTVLRELAAGTLCAVPLDCSGMPSGAIVRPLGIIRARGKPLAPTIERFIELLRQHASSPDATPISSEEEAAGAAPESKRPTAAQRTTAPVLA